MDFKKIFVFLIFWWAAIFPSLFFTETELINIENGNVSYEFWICDFLEDN